LWASQVQYTDVRALEACMHTLQHGCLGGGLEPGSTASPGAQQLSVRNCSQLMRLLQLAMEYTWHLRDAHMRIASAYSTATATARRYVPMSWRCQWAGRLATAVVRSMMVGGALCRLKHPFGLL
jgi:hypothetical protein